MPLWVIYTVLAGLGTIGFNTLNRRTLNSGHDSTVYAWVFEFMRVLIFLPFLFFDFHVIWNTRSILLFIGMGLTELIAVFLFMKMHAHAELSLSSVLSRLRVIWTPLLSYILLGEILTTTQYLGIALIFVSCILIFRGINGFGYKGAVYAVAFSVVNSFSNIFVKEASVYASSSVTTILFALPSVILLPFIMSSGRQRIINCSRSLIFPLFFASIFNALTMYTFVSALRLAPSGQVTGVFQGIAMLTVLSGIIFLKEKNMLVRKLLAATISLIGVILLI